MLSASPPNAERDERPAELGRDQRLVDGGQVHPAVLLRRAQPPEAELLRLAAAAPRTSSRLEPGARRPARAGAPPAPAASARLRTNSRAVSRIARCSSDSAKSTIGPPLVFRQSVKYRRRHVNPTLRRSTVLVTGGASGIGAATVRRFAAEGATVAVADLDESGARKVAGEVGGCAVHLDVADWPRSGPRSIGRARDRSCRRPGEQRGRRHVRRSSSTPRPPTGTTGSR